MMKLNVKERDKDLLIVEVEGAKQNIPNLIRKVLWEDPSVELAAYEKKHPYMGFPAIVIRAKDPKKALSAAIKRAEDQIKDFREQFEKAVK